MTRFRKAVDAAADLAPGRPWGASRAFGRNALALVAVGLALGSPGAAAQTPRANQCVACHQGLPDRSQAGHSFASWRQSRHAIAGVRCEACHGGDPATADRELAHRQIVRSTQPSSPLFTSQIPQTCGRCHAAELGYFRSSLHYARLRTDGRGPNCVTCHGAMATSVLTSEGVLSTCSACHTAGGAAPPDKARESAPILALVRAETMLYSAVAADPRATRGSRAAPMLASARRNLSAAAEVWHTFRLDSASARLAAARQDISGAWTALGHRPPLEARLPETPRSERP